MTTVVVVDDENVIAITEDESPVEIIGAPSSEISVSADTPVTTVVIDEDNIIEVIDASPSVEITEENTSVTVIGVPQAFNPWITLTQAQYDALDPPDPSTLYIVVPG